MIAMLSEKRRNDLLAHVRTRRTVSVEDLAELLDVSVSTVRRDLDALDGHGLLRRVHGGAMALDGGPDEPPIAERTIANPGEKRRIAAEAARLVSPGGVILLTGGSTTAQMVPHLVTVPGLTVVTNSVAIAYAIGTASATTQVLVLGGLMRNAELSLLGHLTTQALADLRIDAGFFSAYGVDSAYGMLGAHLAEAETDRSMIAAATRLVVLADHTKFTRRSAVRIAPLSGIDTLVTDTRTPPGAVTALRSAGVTVVTA